MKYATLIAMICMTCYGCEQETDAEGAENSAGKKASTLKKKVPKKTPEFKVENEEDARILLVGIWRLDVSSVKADAEIMGLPEHERAPALKQRRENMRNVAYEFGEKNKLTIFLGGESVQRGAYDIKKGEKNILSIDVNTVGPIGSRTDSWQVSVKEKSLKVRSAKTGQTLRFFRGGPPPARR